LPQRLIVAITGASGVIYGIRMLEVLRQRPEIETHLVMSAAARATIGAETSYSPREVEKLASVVHPNANIGATIASGSFETLGMVVAPCSIKTLSAVAHCYSQDLIARAADVQLKEGRPVLLLVRETPLHRGHLRLMQLAASQGAIIMPPVPAFYNRPQTLDDIVNHTVGRALKRIGIANELIGEWGGL
jgi:4-hydroxy-3-polyprenylbenzoate decarboxylase